MGWLNTRYNLSFRALFLKTLNPANLYEHFLAWQVNANTFLFDRMESIVGLRNVSYLLALCVLWWYTGLYEIFFVMTSFIHYFRCRGDGEVGSFKRDVFLFQTLAWIQLLYRYLNSLDEEADFIALGMIFAGLVTTDPIITLLGFYKAIHFLSSASSLVK